MLVGKLEEKRLLGKPGQRWIDIFFNLPFEKQDMTVRSGFYSSKKGPVRDLITRFFYKLYL